MKIWKIVLIPLIILILVLPVAACSTTSSQPDTQKQLATVTRGDLMLKVNGSGKIAISNYANLSFGSGGKLAVLNVKEGDTVTKGTVLAKLDTASLEVALSQAQVALDQFKIAQTAANSALTAAQFNLDKTQAVSEIKDAITNAEWTIKAAQVSLDQARLSNDASAYNTMAAYINTAQLELYNQQKKLQTLLNQPTYAGVLTYNIFDQTYDRLTVEDVHLKELAVQSAQQTVDQAQHNIDQAQKNIDYVQKQLNDATITAPFDGIVAVLNYKQGDIIPSPTVSPQVIIYLVDNSNLEADINVDEMDVPSVQIGQRAIINVDAFPGTTLEGKVFSVSTVPNAQAAATGATVYTAKISFTVPQGMAIKAGMNSNAAIVTSQRNNVLLVPNQAIKTDGQGKNYVEMMNSEKMVDQTIVKGLSDSSKTEIVSGLKEGDKVMAPVTVGKWSIQ